MNETVFKELHERRSGYPLGISSFNVHENAFDNKYIDDEINIQSDSDFLFLLLINEHLDKRQLRDTREKIAKQYQTVGIFGVGDILSPVTNVRFTLHVFSKTTPLKIWFGELLGGRHPFKRRTIPRDAYTGSGTIAAEYGEAEKYFIKYLDSIDLAIHGDKKDDYLHDSYRIFGVDSNKLISRTSVDYYKPELIEAEAKLAHERVVKLHEIADIIRPTDFTVDNELYSISLKDAQYPLRSDALKPVRMAAKATFVKQHDIVTNTFLGSAFLNLTRRPDLVIANTQIIIRLHDRRFNHAYLTAYLNSVRMKAYFARHKRGVTIPQLSLQDLRDFEIVIPDERTNESSMDFLNSLDDFQSEAEKLAAINKALFRETAPAGKPLQNELLSDLHHQLQTTKNLLIRDLFDVDLHEIEKCYKAGAYKGCLALCGSLLEAVVLDWLSEIDNKDYFAEVDFTELRVLINKLKDAEVLTINEVTMAHEIRKKRNLIHPKNYIANTPLHEEICQEVMNRLKPLVAKRYNYREEQSL